VERLRKAVKVEAKLTVRDENNLMQEVLASIAGMKTQTGDEAESTVVWKEFEDEVREAMLVMRNVVQQLKTNPEDAKLQSSYILVEKRLTQQQRCYAKFKKPKKSSESLLEIGESYSQEKLDDMMVNDPAAVYEMQAKENAAPKKAAKKAPKAAPQHPKENTADSKAAELAAVQEKAELSSDKAEDAAIRDVRRFGKIQRPTIQEVDSIKQAAVEEKQAEKMRQAEVLAAAEGELMRNAQEGQVDKINKREDEEAAEAARDEEKQEQAMKEKKEEATKVREEARQALGESQKAHAKTQAYSKKAHFLVKQANMMEAAADTMKKRIDTNAHGAATVERSAEEKIFKQQVERTEDARSAAREELKDEGALSGHVADSLKKGAFMKEVKYELHDGEDKSELQMGEAVNRNAKEQEQISEKVAAGKVDLNNNMGSFREYLKTATKGIVKKEQRKAEKAFGTDGTDSPTVEQKKLADLGSVAEQAKQEEQKLQTKEDKQLAKEEAKVSKMKAEKRTVQKAEMKKDDQAMKAALAPVKKAQQGQLLAHEEESERRAAEGANKIAQFKEDIHRKAIKRNSGLTGKAPAMTAKQLSQDIQANEKKASDERKSAELFEDNERKAMQKADEEGKKAYAATTAKKGDEEFKKAKVDQRKADGLCEQSPKCIRGMAMIERANTIEHKILAIRVKMKARNGAGVFWAGLSVCASHGRRL